MTWYSLLSGIAPTLGLLQKLYIFKGDFSRQTMIVLGHKSCVSLHHWNRKANSASFLSAIYGSFWVCVSSLPNCGTEGVQQASHGCICWCIPTVLHLHQDIQLSFFKVGRILPVLITEGLRHLGVLNSYSKSVNELVVKKWRESFLRHKKKLAAWCSLLASDCWVPVPYYFD